MFKFSFVHSLKQSIFHCQLQFFPQPIRQVDLKVFRELRENRRRERFSFLRRTFLINLIRTPENLLLRRSSKHIDNFQTALKLNSSLQTASPRPNCIFYSVSFFISLFSFPGKRMSNTGSEHPMGGSFHLGIFCHGQMLFRRMQST